MLAELAAPSHNAAIMKKPGLVIDDLRAMLEASTPTSRLGRWLIANQAAFEELLATVPPRWEVLAVKFAEEGLITVPSAFWDEDDTPERRLARKRAAEAARQVWHRVKQRPARAGEPAPRSPAPPPAPSLKRPRGPAPMAASDPAPGGADDDEFRPVRPRKE
jgi:hypothetical protein